MKTLYVAFKKVGDNYGTCHIQIEGKINVSTVTELVKQKLQNYNGEIIIISWQEETA